MYSRRLRNRDDEIIGRGGMDVILPTTGCEGKEHDGDEPSSDVADCVRMYLSVF